MEHKQAHVKRTNTLSVTDPDKEEQDQDHVSEECENFEDKESNAELKLQREFSASSDNGVCSAKKN